MKNLSGLYLFLQDVELFFPWPQISRSAVSSLKIDAGHPVPSWVTGLVSLRSQLVDKSVLVCNNRAVYWTWKPLIVTAKSSKIIGLISDDRNLQEVKEKLIHVDNAFTRLQEAHHDYSIPALSRKWRKKIRLIPSADCRLDNCDWRETPRRLASTRFSCKTWRLNKLCWRVRTMKGIKSL